MPAAIPAASAAASLPPFAPGLSGLGWRGACVPTWTGPGLTSPKSGCVLSSVVERRLDRLASVSSHGDTPSRD